MPRRPVSPTEQDFVPSRRTPTTVLRHPGVVSIQNRFGYGARFFQRTNLARFQVYLQLSLYPKYQAQRTAQYLLPCQAMLQSSLRLQSQVLLHLSLPAPLQVYLRPSCQLKQSPLTLLLFPVQVYSVLHHQALKKFPRHLSTAHVAAPVPPSRISFTAQSVCVTFTCTALILTVTV